MLQINKFAKLCHCKASLLRYYDSHGILVPCYIDDLTGYRYYQSEQALDFYRIKQLQSCGLSIKEIKACKNKSDDEVIGILNMKLNEQKQIVNSIENLIHTYQEDKMKLEETVNKFNKQHLLNVESKDNKLNLSIHGNNLCLNFNKKTDKIAELLNTMQKQSLIYFEDFDDLTMYENETWNYTKIASGWNTKNELLKMIEQSQIDKKICIHLFNINESINLFDIADIMNLADENGYHTDTSLFNVSLSLDGINNYAIVYVDK